jgi:hypothetical protein
LTATSSDSTALAEILQIVLVSSLFTLWFSSRRSNDPSGFGNGAMCFVISGSNDVSLWHCRRTKQGALSLHAAALQFGLYRVKRIPAGTTARLVQKMIAAREAIRYSVMRRLLLMRDGSFDYFSHC